MRIALVADWLTTLGGAEQVLRECVGMFPDATVFTTVARSEVLERIGAEDVRCSARLMRLYRCVRRHQFLLPLMPRAIEDIDLRGFDLVLSLSHAVAKGVIVPPGARHICYCHTPMRYAWEMEETYLNDFRVPQMLRPMLRRELKKLRRWDLTTSKRVDHFLANSSATQERIARIYGRKSVVVPPPVDDRFFEAKKGSDPPAVKGLTPFSPYFLALGRLVPYKRFDLVIEAANAMKIPLLVAGAGHEEAHLRSIAGPTVTVLGNVEDSALAELYTHAQALIFPQEEDAGVVLLEALACGTPAIIYGRGGALDAVEEGSTGIIFHEQTVGALTQAIMKFQARSWDRTAIRAFARQFSRENFRRKILAAIQQAQKEALRVP